MRQYGVKLISVSIKFLVYIMYVLIIALGLSKISSLDYYDSLSIIGVVLIIIGGIMSSDSKRIMPSMTLSPSQRNNSINLDSNVGANIEVEKSESNLNMERIGNNIVPINSIMDILLKRKGLELFIYGVIVLGIGFIKYYSYLI